MMFSALLNHDSYWLINIDAKLWSTSLEFTFKVADIKKLIETTTQGQNVDPADRQLLIYQGKLLKDETTLVEKKVLEDDTMIVLLKCEVCFMFNELVVESLHFCTDML